MTAPKIYAALAQATADISISGVGKDGLNSHQKFNYRSIDSIRKGVSPVLAKNGLVITSQVHEIERTQSGRDISATYQHEFTIYAVDGSSVAYSLVLSNVGKDPSKLAGISSSYAYKTMIIDLLCIPCDGADDLDGRDENGVKATFMPKVETNDAGVQWIECKAKTKDDVLAWAASVLPGEDIPKLFDNTKVDSNNRKSGNFKASVRKKWLAAK